MRFRALLAALAATFLWAAPAHAVSPSPDGTCNTGATNTACPTNAAATSSPATVSVTTTGGAGCMVVFVGVQNTATAAPTVSSIASTNTTGWTKRAGITDAHNDLEEWSGTYASALTAETVTVTLTASPTGNMSVQALSVKGTHSGCSFDSHSAATTSPATVAAGVTTVTTSQTTGQADDMLISATWGGNGNFSGMTSGTFNSVAATIVGSGLHNSSGVGNDGTFGVFELGVSATQSGITDTQTGNAGGDSFSAIAIADALTADASGGGGCARHSLTLTGAGC